MDQESNDGAEGAAESAAKNSESEQNFTAFYHLARYFGRRLPLPLRLKIMLREALLRTRDPRIPDPDPTPVRPAAAPTIKPPGGETRAAMRPECCGLQAGLVTVVLPVYNQADLLEEAVESVLTQTYENLELILVDDGSGKEVKTLLEQYALRPRIRCFTQENQGLPKALSNGFDLARGEFWTWTSADNIMEPRMLERLTAKLESEPELGMVYADYYVIDDRGKLLRDKSWRWQNRPRPRSGEVRLPRNAAKLNTVQDNFIGPCFLYRGWIGKTLGDYAPQTGIEDYDYWMRLNAFFPLRHLGDDEPLYRYRVHDNTLSARAGEHRIVEKVRRLMQEERRRADCFRAPLQIAADETVRLWLQAVGMPEGELRPVDNPQGQWATADVDLLALDSCNAAAHADELMALNTPLALLFTDEAAVRSRLLRLLRRDGCIALANNRRAAARVRLASDCPLLDSEAAQAPAAMLAFARNHRRFHEQWSADQLSRRLPTQRVSTAGRHVLLQLDSFTQGGMENVVIDLAHSLRAAGFKATIANLGAAGAAAARARAEGLAVASFPRGLAARDYTQWLERERVELVNAHYSLFAAQACREAGIPFLETIHNAYVWLEPDAIRAYRQADAAISAYLCVSATAALYADMALGLDVAKMRVVPNGIDASRLDAPNYKQNRRALREAWGLSTDTPAADASAADEPAAAPVFLNVASIMATKAQMPLVKAYATVLRQYPDARLVLLGDAMEKPYLREVEKTARRLGIADKIVFAGYDPDTAPYYHAADVFVLPSYWEGWSLSLGEALANGLSCVVADVGAAYEFADHPRVEIIAPPFHDITELNYRNLAPIVYGDHPAFTASLAKAMLRAAARPRHPLDTALAERLDRRRAYARYAEIFGGNLEFSA